MLGFRVTAIADLCELSFAGFMNSVWFLKCLFFCLLALRLAVGLFGRNRILGLLFLGDAMVMGRFAARNEPRNPFAGRRLVRRGRI